MAVDGKWEITINSPLGAQKAVLDLKSDGPALNGTQTAQAAPSLWPTASLMATS